MPAIKSIDEPGRNAGMDCQKCSLLGIKQIPFTDGNRESHELLHKRHAQILLFPIENNQPEASQQENSKTGLRRRTRRRSGDATVKPKRFHVMNTFDDATKYFLQEAVSRCKEQSGSQSTFMCQICYTTLGSKNQPGTSWFQLFDHARSHTGKLYFYCSLCPHESANKRQMYQHKRRKHRSDTAATNWRIIERQMQQEDFDEILRTVMLCVDCKRTTGTTEGATMKATESARSSSCDCRNQSEEETNVTHGDADMSADTKVANAAEKGQGRFFLRRKRQSLCRMLFAQNAVNDRLICRICTEQRTEAACTCKNAYTHAMRHANLPAFTCNICSTTRNNFNSMWQHINIYHNQLGRNNFTDHSDEFHDQIVTQIVACFGSSKTQM